MSRRATHWPHTLSLKNTFRQKTTSNYEQVNIHEKRTEQRQRTL